MKFDFKTPCEGNTASSFPDPHFIGLNSPFSIPGSSYENSFFFSILFLLSPRAVIRFRDLKEKN